MTRLDQSRASEKIWWIIISDIPQFQLGNIRSRDVFRPIARERKYLMDYKSQYGKRTGGFFFLGGGEIN